MQASGTTDHYPRGGIFTFWLVKGLIGKGEAHRGIRPPKKQPPVAEEGVYGRNHSPQRQRGLVSPTAARASTHQAATSPEACKKTARCTWRIGKIPARPARRIRKIRARSGRLPDGDITVARQGCGSRMGERSAEAARCHIPLQPYPLLQGRNGKEVATMTDLVIITAAILELIVSAVHLAAAIIERLPVRKGKEQ